MPAPSPQLEKGGADARTRPLAPPGSLTRHRYETGSRNVVVAVISWQISIPGCRSLKEKRMVVRSLKDRIRARFNVSVAETDHQDVWSRLELTAAVVSSDGRFADSVLNKLDAFVENDRRGVIVDSRREVW